MNSLPLSFLLLSAMLAYYASIHLVITCLHNVA